MKCEWTPKLFSLIKEGITAEQLKKDINAGLIVGILALPLAIAFAVASGVSPEKGILTAVVAGLLISLFGGSRVQIGGPTGAFIVIVLGILGEYGADGLLAATFLGGIILVLMGVLRLGQLLKYVPQTLINGFTTAIAVIIFTSQIQYFLGLESIDLPDAFLEKWGYYLMHLKSANPWAVALTLLSLGTMILLPRLTRKIPPAFAAIVLCSLITLAADLPVETIGSRFGELSASLPEPALPRIGRADIISLLPPAFTIALLGALESLLSAVVADGMIGGKHRSNMELIAQGVANMVSPLFGGLPATGAIARTAANINAGGRTPLSGIVHALTLLLIYLVAMPVVSYIPMASLAGILIMVSWNMAEFHEFISVLKINRYEAAVLLLTFFLTILTDLTIAVPLGFLLALILFMKRMADGVELSPLMQNKSEDSRIFSRELGEVSEDIIFYELSGPMFFGSAHHLLKLSGDLQPSHSILILRFRYVPIVDASGLAKLKQLVKDLSERKIMVIFSGVNEELEAKFIRNGILPESLIFETAVKALDFAESLLKNRQPVTDLSEKDR
ncbi:MAG: SulP family inorganic anion transporter [Spirochaetales bacterium]|nr:SulP family inorganic anion transporter [Spirochaetales bacterium]